MPPHTTQRPSPEPQRPPPQTDAAGPRQDHTVVIITRGTPNSRADTPSIQRITESAPEPKKPPAKAAGTPPCASSPGSLARVPACGRSNHTGGGPALGISETSDGGVTEWLTWPGLSAAARCRVAPFAVERSVPGAPMRAERDLKIWLSLCTPSAALMSTRILPRDRRCAFSPRLRLCLVNGTGVPGETGVPSNRISARSTPSSRSPRVNSSVSTLRSCAAAWDSIYHSVCAPIQHQPGPLIAPSVRGRWPMVNARFSLPRPRNRSLGTDGTAGGQGMRSSLPTVSWDSRSWCAVATSSRG